ncbi:MAG: hypothetical protein SGCHY_002021 [Lobulomycetales sp.]
MRLSPQDVADELDRRFKSSANANANANPLDPNLKDTLDPNLKDTLNLNVKDSLNLNVKDNRRKDGLSKEQSDLADTLFDSQHPHALALANPLFPSLAAAEKDPVSAVYALAAMELQAAPNPSLLLYIRKQATFLDLPFLASQANISLALASGPGKSAMDCIFAALVINANSWSNAYTSNPIAALSANKSAFPESKDIRPEIMHAYHGAASKTMAQMAGCKFLSKYHSQKEKDLSPTRPQTSKKPEKYRDILYSFRLALQKGLSGLASELLLQASRMISPSSLDFESDFLTPWRELFPASSFCTLKASDEHRLDALLGMDSAGTLGVSEFLRSSVNRPRDALERFPRLQSTPRFSPAIIHSCQLSIINSSENAHHPSAMDHLPELVMAKSFIALTDNPRRLSLALYWAERAAFAAGSCQSRAEALYLVARVAHELGLVQKRNAAADALVQLEV